MFRSRIKRRARNFAMVVLAVAVIWLWLQLADLSLQRPAAISGWLLVSSCLILALYQWRKRFATVPLGSNATWLQAHIYLGLVAATTFLFHISWSLPDHRLGIILTVLFVLTVLSGMVGIVLSRRYAKRLRHSQEELIYERIPAFRVAIRSQAEQLMVDVAKTTGSSTLPDFYARYCGEYFSRATHRLAHCMGSNQHLEPMNLALQDHQRYMSDNELVYVEQLQVLIKQKDLLDKHHALQAAMKFWILLHVPPAMAMLVAIMVHIVAVYAYRGGL